MTEDSMKNDAPLSVEELFHLLKLENDEKLDALRKDLQEQLEAKDIENDARHKDLKGQLETNKSENNAVCKDLKQECFETKATLATVQKKLEDIEGAADLREGFNTVNEKVLCPKLLDSMNVPDEERTGFEKLGDVLRKVRETPDGENKLARAPDGINAVEQLSAVHTVFGENTSTGNRLFHRNYPRDVAQTVKRMTDVVADQENYLHPNTVACLTSLRSEMEDAVTEKLWEDSSKDTQRATAEADRERAKGLDCCKIRLENIHVDCTVEELRAFMVRNVAEPEIIAYRFNTRIKRGFSNASVVFREWSDADKAVRFLDGSFFMGKKINVEFDIPPDCNN